MGSCNTCRGVLACGCAAAAPELESTSLDEDGKPKLKEGVSSIIPFDDGEDVLDVLDA